MLKEKMIEDKVLFENVDKYIKIIHEYKITFIINKKLSNGVILNYFVLGPSEICGNIIGLYDEEYGWPITIKTSEINSISDLTPQHRKHPYIIDDNNHLAISISLSEYQDIKKKF